MIADAVYLVLATSLNERNTPSKTLRLPYLPFKQLHFVPGDVSNPWGCGFSLFQHRLVHFDVPISREPVRKSGPVREGGKNHRLGRHMEGPSASNACRLQSLLSPALNNPQST